MLTAVGDPEAGKVDRLADRRADVPLLHEAGTARALHCLDEAATTHKPGSVIAAFDECYREFNAPIHRGPYALAEEKAGLSSGPLGTMMQLWHSQEKRHGQSSVVCPSGSETREGKGG
jgi:hypothetical protein